MAKLPAFSRLFGAGLVSLLALAGCGSGDGTICLTVESVSVVEGDTPGNSVTFTVHLSERVDEPVVVAYSTEDGSATAGSDYTAESGTFTFAPNTLTQMLTIPVTGDISFEPDETFSVAFAIVSGNGEAGPVVVPAVIENDDLPRLDIAGTSVTEGNSGTANATFTVTLTDVLDAAVTVDYATGAGTATAGSDYTTVSGTLTFAPGVTSQSVIVPVLGDTTVEPDETFTVTLSNASANAEINTASATGTIINDDFPVVSIAGTSVAEGNSGTSDAVFVVTASTTPFVPITVAYATADGTAAAGSDYTGTSGVLTLGAGVTSQNITVPVLGDTTVELNETFLVALSNPANASLGTASATGTIVNDDFPVLTITDVSVTEGDSATTTNLTFTVTASPTPLAAITVDYATADGTAVAGSDYTGTSGTLTFNPGVASQSFTVSVLGDSLVEPDETFQALLSNPTNANLGTASATGTILNDDVPALSIADVSVTEGNSGVTNATFTVTASQTPLVPITVAYATVDDTALAGSDYTAASGVLTFDVGVTSQTFIVPVLGDAAVEADETFIAEISNPTNATLDIPSALGTILNDDFPTASIAGVSVLEGDSGTSNAAFVVTLSEPFPAGDPNGGITIGYATADGTATTAGNDYVATSGTLTIPAGDSGGTIQVPVTGDTTWEPDETLTVTLSNPSANVVLGTSVATGTLLNDDPGGIADTAVTACGDSAQNGLPCPVASYPGQDAQSGWDVQQPDSSDGFAGFSYTKVDATGAVLPAGATAWSCVLDHRTGLLWEVKSVDGGLHDQQWTYTWFSTDVNTNGGLPGTAAGGSCGGTVAAGCDTEKFVAAVNEAALCGRSDWRLPSVEELRSLVDYSIPAPGPTIDVAWFPNTLGTYYWSRISNGTFFGELVQNDEAWAMYFADGYDWSLLKSEPHAVRLVRGAP